MKVFILPSWCPSSTHPLSGSFFFEQAACVASLRPNWKIAICSFNLEETAIPWRPKKMPLFFRNLISQKAVKVEERSAALLEYKVWRSYVPHYGFQSAWKKNIRALEAQVRPALRDFIARFGKPDLLHAQAIYPAGLVASSLGSELNFPVLLTEHLGPFPPKILTDSEGRLYPDVKKAYEKLSGNGAVSSSVARTLEALSLGRNIRVIPNFLPDNFYQAQGAKIPRTAGFNLLSVGGPSNDKGTDLLLKSLVGTSPEIKLTLIGESGERRYFQELARTLGVAGRVSWIGMVPRDRMSSYYEWCDAVILPSRGESFGVTLIEALAHGKPLIATRCGGPEDIVTKQNGFLVESNHLEQLTAAIIKMSEVNSSFNPEEIKADFAARFSASGNIQKIEDWYRSAVETHQKHEGR